MDHVLRSHHVGPRKNIHKEIISFLLRLSFQIYLSGIPMFGAKLLRQGRKITRCIRHVTRLRVKVRRGNNTHMRMRFLSLFVRSVFPLTSSASLSRCSLTITAKAPKPCPPPRPTACRDAQRSPSNARTQLHLLGAPTTPSALPTAHEVSTQHAAPQHTTHTYDAHVHTPHVHTYAHTHAHHTRHKRTRYTLRHTR